jgi:hypothetical protein
MSSPGFYLEHGNRFPYDAPDKWWKSSEENPPAAADWAHEAARGVLADLQDRRDIKRGFENVDEDVRAELVQDLAEIIRIAGGMIEVES